MNTPLLSNGVGELTYTSAVPVPLLAYLIKEAIPRAVSGPWGDFLFQEIPTPEAVVWYNNYLLRRNDHFINTGPFPKLELQFSMNNSFVYHGEGIGKQDLRDGSFNIHYVPVVNSRLDLRAGRLYTTFDIYLTPVVMLRLEKHYCVLEKFLAKVERREVATLCPVNQLTTIPMGNIIGDILENSFIEGGHTVYVATKVTELLLVILQRITSHPRLTEVFFREEELQLLYAAKDEMGKNLDKHMTLLSLSKRVGLNRNKLRIGIQELYGCSVTAFRLQARMKEAKFLLRTTNNTIESIGFDTGYSNVQHFSKAYKLFFGNTPLRYRRDMQ